MKSITVKCNSDSRRSKIDEFTRYGYTLINEHTVAYMNGGADDITLVFEPTHHPARKGELTN